MNEELPLFIGREEELENIQKQLLEWGTQQFIFVSGSGGIGKTKLSLEVYRRHHTNEKLLIPALFDFDDPSLHITENVGRELAERLARKEFEDYLRGLNDLRKMESAGVSREKLLQETATANKIFVDCFNRLSASTRIVLLFDTMEAIQEEDLWKNFLQNLIPLLHNTVIILSGRKVEMLEDSLKEIIGTDKLTSLPLTGFTPEEAGQYFDGTEIGKEIAPAIREKIHFLADGRPILIDLAIDWLGHDVPLPDLVKKSLEEIKGLEKDELKDLRQEFEDALVSGILRFNKPIDRAILEMACVRRYFNSEIIAYLQEISVQESDEIINDLSKLSFVKPRPRNNFVLHDEMRRLVDTYVWSKYDPLGTQKQKTHEKMTQYYLNKIVKIDEEIKDTTTSLNKARETKDAQQEIFAFDSLATLQREYWLLRIEHLYHALRTDLKKGLEAFTESADLATNRFRFDFRDLMFSEIKQFENQYEEVDRYEIEIREAKYLLDDAKYQAGHDRVKELIQKYSDGAGREVDMLMQLGNIVIRMGKANEALKYFEEALEICEKRDLKEWAGRIYNDLGWANRLMARWKEAAQYYEKSLEYSEKINDLIRIADAYNNLGYVLGLHEDYESALVYCKGALEIRQKLALPRDIGISHNTLSIIYRSREEWETSIEHSDAALSIFESQNDIEWLAKAYRERGVTRWFTNELSKAKDDLEKSRKFCEDYGYRSELPNTYHRLGHVYWELGLVEARQDRKNAKMLFDRGISFFKKSYEVGLEVVDVHMTINSLAGSIESLYDRMKQFPEERFDSEIDEYYNKLRDYEKKGEYIYPLYYGSAERVMGGIAQNKGDYDKALNHYKRGFPLIAKGGRGYSRYILTNKALPFLHSKINELSPDMAIAWIDKLIEHWKEEGLDIQFPEFINHCKVWKTEQRLKKV